MSDDTEEVLLKVRLRDIAMRVRLDLTEKYITAMIGYMRSRARHGYTSYTTDALPDNVCRDQLQEWFKKERMIMTCHPDDSITVYW